MKKLTYLLSILIFPVQLEMYAQANLLAAKKGWQSLFDGKTLNGWRQADKPTAPSEAWSAANGELTFDPSKGHGGDIITTKTFTDFDLSIQFKISEGGNSGIKYFLIPNTSLGCEYQIIDDIKHPDAALGLGGNRKVASLYDLIAADPRKKLKPAGQWNTARIVAKGNHVEHWLNGAKALEYERGSEKLKEYIAKSKFKTTKGFAEAKSTSILLQAHGDKVIFRNLKIKEL